MAATVRNNRGFSLVEMLVAVVLIAFALMALSTMMVHLVYANVENDMRNTAVRLTNQTEAILLALPLDSLRSCGLTSNPNAPNYDASYTYSSANECLGSGTEYQKYPDPEQSVRGTIQQYNITWSVSALSDSLREITVIVSYRYNETDHINSSVIYRNRMV